MELVPGFMLLLQPFASTMTTPTFDSLTTLVTGWVFARRRTVTRLILAAGDAADKHYSSYHRVFSAARWSLDTVGLAVFDLMRPFLGEVVTLGIDDTLARKRGQKMFGCGMHHDPLLSSRSKTITNWGHSWGVLGVIVELPFADCEARMHAAPNRPLRVVAVEALQGDRGQEAFYSTCYQATAEQVIAWYASRWSIEVSFHDSKQHLGFEEPQGWSRKAVERTAPLAMLLYSLIVLWFAREGHQFYQPLNCPWYTTKAESSFADMLTTLRRRSMRQKVLSLALRGPGSRKIKLLLENVVALAT